MRTHTHTLTDLCLNFFCLIVIFYLFIQHIWWSALHFPCRGRHKGKKAYISLKWSHEFERNIVCMILSHDLVDAKIIGNSQLKWAWLITSNLSDITLSEKSITIASTSQGAESSAAHPPICDQTSPYCNLWSVLKSVILYIHTHTVYI